jgi:hypothetical protein
MKKPAILPMEQAKSAYCLARMKVYAQLMYDWVMSSRPATAGIPFTRM